MERGAVGKEGDFVASCLETDAESDQRASIAFGAECDQRELHFKRAYERGR